MVQSAEKQNKNRCVGLLASIPPFFHSSQKNEKCDLLTILFQQKAIMERYTVDDLQRVLETIHRYTEEISKLRVRRAQINEAIACME